MIDCKFFFFFKPVCHYFCGRVGQRGTGLSATIARSEHEISEIIDGLSEQEVSNMWNVRNKQQRNTTPFLSAVSFVCGLIASCPLFHRTTKNRWDSFRSSHQWCTTWNRGESGLSTWMVWWTTPWRCTNLGSSWMFGPNMRRRSSRRSKAPQPSDTLASAQSPCVLTAAQLLHVHAALIVVALLSK